MKLSIKHIVNISTVIFCVMAVFLIICLSSTPANDPASLSNYIKKHEPVLIELTTNYPNQYKKLNGYLGIQALDTRTEANACFIFSWSYDKPEGISCLYYTSNRTLDIAGYSFSDTARISGLGINGQGYINCTMLKQNWFFVEANIPT